MRSIHNTISHLKLFIVKHRIAPIVTVIFPATALAQPIAPIALAITLNFFLASGIERGLEQKNPGHIYRRFIRGGYVAWEVQYR